MKKILVVGGSGLVGSRFIELQKNQFEIMAPSHHELDVTNPDAVDCLIDRVQPDQILYAAGYTNVDLAESQPKQAYALNVQGPQNILEVIKDSGTPFYYLSTDYVFNGQQSDRPYTEFDDADPVDQVYAKSKREGEIVTLQTEDVNGVIRLIMPFSASYTRKTDLTRTFLSRLKNKEKIQGVIDQKINPVFVDDLVKAIGLIMKKGAKGIYHVGAVDFTTPYDYAMLIAKTFGLDSGCIEKFNFAEFAPTRPAKRPQHTWLDTSKFRSEFGEEVLHTIEKEIEIFKVQVDSLR